MIIGRRRKRGNGGNELKDTFSGNVCECKKLMSSMAWEWDGEVGAVRAGARANEAFRKVGEEEEKEEKEEEGEKFFCQYSMEMLKKKKLVVVGGNV